MTKMKKRLTALLLALLMILSLAACSDGKDNDGGTKQGSDADEINIVPTAASSIETERYDNGDFSLDIPKCWTVTSGGAYMLHSIRVYDPENPINQMFFMLKADCLLHSQAGKDAWQYNYQMGNSQAILFASAPVLSSPSTEGFFKIFPQYAEFISSVESSYAGYSLPSFESFTVTDRFASTSSLAASALGDELLRATFTDGDKNGEGMFSASVVDFGQVQIPSGGVSGYQLQSADGGYYMAYNIVAVTAEKDTFIDWEPVLAKCMASLEYSDSFVSSAKQASNETVALAMQISRNFNETMNSIMAAWESRSTSQDIMSQKQSDAILGYERIYNTETGETYKADLGWSDTHDSALYKPVEDDSMYLKATSGYIVD